MHNAQQPTVVGYLYVHTSFRSALFGLCFQERILKPKQLWEFIRCPKTYKVVAENLVFLGGLPSWVKAFFQKCRTEKVVLVVFCSGWYWLFRKCKGLLKSRKLFVEVRSIS